MAEQELKAEYEEKIEQYKKAMNSEDDARWKKGDLALDVEVKYGQRKLQQFSKDVGEEYNTLRIYRKVSGEFKKDMRTTFSDLTWTHFFIAGMTDNPSEWLSSAKKEGLTTRQLKEKIREKKEPISETRREVTSLSLNKHVFEKFKDFCKEKNIIMSYLIEDIMVQILKKNDAGEIVDSVNIKLQK